VAVGVVAAVEGEAEAEAEVEVEVEVVEQAGEAQEVGSFAPIRPSLAPRSDRISRFANPGRSGTRSITSVSSGAVTWCLTRR